MILKASWVHRNAPVRLMSTAVFHCSKLRSSKGTPEGRFRIVEEQVQPTEDLFGPGEQGLHGIREGSHRPGPPGPERLQTPASFAVCIRGPPAPAGQDHPVPVLQKCEGNGFSDAAACHCDESHFVVTAHFGNLLRFNPFPNRSHLRRTTFGA